MADEAPYAPAPPPQTDDVRELIRYLVKELERVRVALDDARARLTAGGL